MKDTLTLIENLLDSIKEDKVVITQNLGNGEIREYVSKEGTLVIATIKPKINEVKESVEKHLATCSIDILLSGKVNDTIFETVYEQGNVDHFAFQVNGKTVFKVPVLDMKSIEEAKIQVAQKAIAMLVDRISKQQ